MNSPKTQEEINIYHKLVEEYGQYALASRIYKEWREGVDERFGLRYIQVQNVDFHGTPSVESVLFIRLLVQTNTAKHSQIVELRGGTCVMLPILHCEGVTYTVLVKQPRLASGQFDLEELPAGMIDGGTFSGAAARELKEEIDLAFTPEELINLTPDGGIYLSPGLSDERAKFYIAEREVTREELTAMQGKATGCPTEGENITLHVVLLSEILHRNFDSKSLIACTLYREYKDDEIKSMF